MTIQDIKDQNLILFEVISGSQAFGLATPASDTDIKGVFYLPKEKFYGLEYIPQISNESNDIVYYELGRFIELLIKNNPNILEMLATPNESVIYKHPLMDKIKIETFLSKLCKDTFAGYGITQIKKAKGLNKKMSNPVDAKRKTPYDFCKVIIGSETFHIDSFLDVSGYKKEKCGVTNVTNAKDTYALFYDHLGEHKYRGFVKDGDISNELRLSSIPKGEKAIAHFVYNKDGYIAHCKEYKAYWDWIEKRNDERYNTNQAHGQNYDAKNLMHTIRLLQTAKHIFEFGWLNIKVPNRDELLAIKKGLYTYDYLLDMAEHLISEIEHLYNKSDLQESPTIETVEKILIDLRNQIY